MATATITTTSESRPTSQVVSAGSNTSSLPPAQQHPGRPKLDRDVHYVIYECTDAKGTDLGDQFDEYGRLHDCMGWLRGWLAPNDKRYVVTRVVKEKHHHACSCHSCDVRPFRTHYRITRETVVARLDNRADGSAIVRIRSDGTMDTVVDVSWPKIDLDDDNDTATDTETEYVCEKPHHTDKKPKHTHQPDEC